MASRGTTAKTGRRFIATSGRVSPSTKTSKPAKPTFGTSSQFRGIGRGVEGDPRK